MIIELLMQSLDRDIYRIPNINDVTTIIIFTPTPPLGQDMTQGQFLSGV